MVRAVAVVLLAYLTLTSAALAAPATVVQQRCLVEIDRRGTTVLQAQAKVADACLADHAAGRIDRLGVPPEAQTAQACPANDVRGRVATSLAALSLADATRCLASPESLPPFAYTGAGTVGGAATVAARGLIEDLFGPDLDATLTTTEIDAAGARCQREVAKQASGLVTTMWRLALAQRRNALAGRGRVTGIDVSVPVASADELATELVTYLLADARGTIGRAVTRLAATTTLRCGATATPLPALFGGACTASSGDAGALAECASRRARARFWQSLATFDGLDVPCDVLDDGLDNDSCAEPRNVVLILADDLGWGDVGFHAGSDPATTIPTPNIDRLAAEGSVLDQFFVQPVCSPTRAEILTGRSATRVGVAPTTLNTRVGQHMSETEVTLAEAFAASGWDTAAIGKWHLGDDATGGPLLQGFGRFTGLLGAAGDYFTRREDDGSLIWQEDGTYVDVPGYTTELITSAAVDFVRARTGTPFFLYVPYTAPHNPQQATPGLLARVPSAFDPARTTFAAMVIGLDDGIGAILDALDDAGLDDDTIVFFASDNGGSQEANNLPLRGGKGGAYDGGVRVPAIIRIPGAAGGTVVTGMIAAMDVFPTLLGLAGASAPAGPPLDGNDVSAGILAAATSLRSEAAWLTQRYDAYRTPQWKLLRRPDGVRELYDVASDPSETTDLASSAPATVEALTAALDAWNADVVARPSHVPLPAGSAAPAGDVIRTVVDIAPGATGSLVQVRLSRAFNVQLHPGDWLEYDLRFAPGTRAAGFVLDLDRTNRTEPWGDNPTVRDQSNLDVGSGEGFTAAVGAWQRRSIGLGSFGTDGRDQAKLMFLDLSPGRYDVQIDNVVLHRFDGSEVVVYRDGPVPDLLVVDAGTTGVTTTVTTGPP